MPPIIAAIPRRANALLFAVSPICGATNTRFHPIDGQAPPPPMLLEELLARWTDNYVMHSQRVAHVLGTGRPQGDGSAAPATATAPAELSLAGNQGARIEFF